MAPTHAQQTAFWSSGAEEMLTRMGSSRDGLTAAAAGRARDIYGPNTLKAAKKRSGLLLFLGQFKSPITIILLAAATLSFFLGDKTDAVIIIIIVMSSTMLGYWQERTAGNAVSRLLSLIRIKASVIRDGQKSEIPTEEVVPGDIVTLSAGDIVPADSLIIEEDELFVDEAAFTGETFPVEKEAGVLPCGTVLSKRTNSVFMGSHVVSGTATVLVVNTGISTEFGNISRSLRKKAPATAFETGIRKFGYMLMQIMVVMVIFLFGVNVLLNKPVLDSLLFTLAIAVGITPQLLPAIITVNLSRGAKRMAGKKVIVKRLDAIENFGNMDVLCSDKTGTLTEGRARVSQSLDCSGKACPRVLLLAKVNAALQQGFKNPLDEAIVKEEIEGTDKYTRLDEIPYDFIRKRLSLLVSDGVQTTLIMKGAVRQVLDTCTGAEGNDGTVLPVEQVSDSIRKLYENLSAQGFRTLGVAYRVCSDITAISGTDERGMVFAGFITLSDPPREGIEETVKELRDYGIGLKIITGDNVLVAKHLSEQVGFGDAIILTGSQVGQMSDSALINRAVRTDVFAEIEPNQKERIIIALKKAGKTVGYIGDGINDVSAIHAADIGLSVNTAVDVAKEAAGLVLLDQDLNVLVEGVKEGRRTFANTQKYIFMAISANFGNMFSMAGATLLLPFLPLLPKQILLMNLMTDFPSMAISTDSVDEDWIKRPRKWDAGFIRRFMVIFGILSSVFDYLTFGILLLLFHAKESEFQTAWFIESVVSGTLIVLVVRTRHSFFRSKPGRYLSLASVSVASIVLMLPNLPFAYLLGFTAVPLAFYPAMLLITGLYILSAELLKKWFYRDSPN